MKKLLLWVANAITMIVMFAAGVGPEDAQSNLAHWYGLVTDDIPAWINSNHVDVIALITGPVLLGVFCYFLFRVYRQERAASVLGANHTQQQQKASEGSVAIQAGGNINIGAIGEKERRG